MAIYDLGTASLAANGEVTGVGTTWKAPLTLIRVGATIVFKTEPVQIYTISEIISDTQINVYNPNSETVPAGTGYAILAHDGITVQGLAQDVAETLRYYQSRETEVAAAVDIFKDFDQDKFSTDVSQVNTQYGEIVTIAAQVSSDAAQVSSDKNSAASSAEAAMNYSEESAQSAQDAINAANSVIEVVNLGNDISNQNYKGTGLIGSFSNRIYVFDSVSQMLSSDFSNSDLPCYVKTLANNHGVKVESDWVISSSKDSSTYSLDLGSSVFANLITKSKMGFHEFGFGSQNSAANSASIDEACRVARNANAISELYFPAGNYPCLTVNLDVDKRGFKFSGAGNDSTVLTSNTDGISLHHVGIDPRDRNRDRLHWHQELSGFTVDGNIGNRGSIAATRAIYTCPYATIRNKSINHRVSNYDLLHLAINWYGHSQGGTSGALFTRYGVRVRNNSQKLKGYIGSTSSGCTVSVEGMSTYLTSAASIGDTTVTVSDASGFDSYFEIAFTNSTGVVETRRVESISGNVITLDRAMTSAFNVNSKVEVPIIGTSIYASTMEIGEVRVGDSQATVINGCYSEEAKFYINKRVRGLIVSGCSAAESSPSMSIDCSRDSVLSIENNDVTFSVALSIRDRSGAISQRVDLYNAPKIKIENNTRMQNSIILNGLYGFDSIKISKTFDTSVSDYRFTEFKFSGLNATSSAGGSQGEFMLFHQDSSTTGFDGYIFDITARCRSVSSGSSTAIGTIKRVGWSDSNATNSTDRVLNAFSLFNQTTGYDIFIGGGSNRGAINIRPHQSVSIKASISGTVTSMA